MVPKKLACGFLLPQEGRRPGNGYVATATSKKRLVLFLAPLAEGDWDIFLSAGGYGSAFSAFRGGALA